MRKIINISVPGSMKQFVEQRVNNGEYASVSEYFRELVRLDQKRERVMNQSIGRHRFLRQKSFPAQIVEGPEST